MPGPNDWLKQRVEGRIRLWEEWLERRKMGQPVEEPWKIIQQETNVKHAVGVSCTNTLSYRISTLPLIPFYNRAYMWIYGLDWAQNRQPIMSESDFKSVHGLTPDEVTMLAEEGTIVPVAASMEDNNPEFVRNFFSNLEMKAIPFMPRALLWMLVDDFQIENKIFLPRPTDPSYGHVEHLLYAAGLQSIWVTDHPIPSFPSQSIEMIERTMRMMNKLPLLQENLEIEYFLKGLNMAYSPKMPLRDYLRVFTPDRRKELRALVARATMRQVAVEEVIHEINTSITELERLAKSKGWRFLSCLSSLVRANALTLTACALGYAGGGPSIALVGAVLAKIAEVKMPDDVTKDLSKSMEKMVAPLYAMLLRCSPSILHMVQMRKQLAELCFNSTTMP